MIEYFIDGSTKDNVIGAGIVKVNEFGFIEKHHFSVEHINPSSNIAEGYSLEKTLQMIKENDLNKNEIINIYTDNQKLFNLLLFNGEVEFNSRAFFTKQESNEYFQYIRNLYIEIISKFSKYPIYYCKKSNQPRPLIKIFYKDETDNKKYLQDAHSLSRKYIKEEVIPIKIELRAVKEKNMWYIKDNKGVVAENKRILIALSEALQQSNAKNKQIKLCDNLERILKYTNKNKLSNESIKSAYKIIENNRGLISS